MERKCKNCAHFTYGVTDKQRKSREAIETNWGHWADGICDKLFPRGYVARKPPHLAHSTGRCFQYEPKEAKDD